MMWIFFDIKERRQTFGEETLACDNCGRETAHSLFRTRSWFTLYFVPLIPVTSSYDVSMCNLCGQRSSDDSFSDIDRPELGRKPCPDCGESIMLAARVCRFCRYEFTDDDVRRANVDNRMLRRDAELESQINRLRWKKRVLAIPGWILLIPGLLMALMMVIVVANAKPGGPNPPARIFGIICATVFFSLPMLTSLLLLYSARNCQRHIDDLDTDLALDELDVLDDPYRHEYYEFDSIEDYEGDDGYR